jgi:hypothetical protein
MIQIFHCMSILSTLCRERIKVKVYRIFIVIFFPRVNINNFVALKYKEKFVQDKILFIILLIATKVVVTVVVLLIILTVLVRSSNCISSSSSRPSGCILVRVFYLIAIFQGRLLTTGLKIHILSFIRTFSMIIYTDNIHFEVEYKFHRHFALCIFSANKFTNFIHPLSQSNLRES